MRSNHMKRVHLVTVVLGVFAILIPAATLLVPVPLNLTISPIEHRVSLALLAFLAWCHIGAAVLFLMGLKDFKQRLKIAYFLICTGLIITGLNMVQLPILGTFNLWESDWATHGGLSFPYTAGLFLIFLGMRNFANALRVKSWLTSATMVLLMVVGTALVSGFLLAADGEFNTDFAARMANAAFVIINTILVLRVKSTAGPAYNAALAWLFLALFCASMAQLGVVAFDILHTQESPLIIIPFALASVLYVKAGHAFNEISEY